MRPAERERDRERKRDRETERKRDRERESMYVLSCAIKNFVWITESSRTIKDNHGGGP